MVAGNGENENVEIKDDVFEVEQTPLYYTQKSWPKSTESTEPEAKYSKCCEASRLFMVKKAIVLGCD